MLRFLCLAVCIQLALPSASATAEPQDRKWLVDYVSRPIAQDARNELRKHLAGFMGDGVE